ncbi:MAG: hypothetical protein DA407_09265 [Bacteroidetes bacterium]|nr:MAG: hypothetical protein DA407_09265 [Bacteroidota bacterium]
MKNNSKFCINCESEIFDGRSDKKYCSKKCKSSYNNKLNELPGSYKAINNILKNDLKLLLKLLEKINSITISKLELKALGFSFKHFTHFEYIESLKRNIYGIYDFSYYFIDDYNIKIIKNEYC